MGKGLGKRAKSTSLGHDGYEAVSEDDVEKDDSETVQGEQEKIAEEKHLNGENNFEKEREEEEKKEDGQERNWLWK